MKSEDGGYEPKLPGWEASTTSREERVKEIECEWLVIGAGPAGAMAARELAKGGREVLCIQRKLDFRKPCGGGVRMDAFGRFGLERDAITHSIDKIGLHDGRKEIEIDISDTPLAIVDRLRFDGSLRIQAKEAGAWIMEATFRSIRKEKGKFHVEISTAMGKETVSASWVIAADGVLSPVRKAWTGEAPSSLLTHYLEERRHPLSDSTAHFHFGHEIAARGYAWDFPGPHGRHIGTLAGNSRLLRFLERLGIEPEGKIRGYRIPDYRNPLFHHDGVFFVGDAAGQVLPFTYEGIFYAIASAEILAHSQLSQENPGAYEKIWHERFGEKFSSLRRLETLFLANDRTIALMMRLYRNPSVQRAMLELWLRDHRNVPSGFGLAKKIFKRLLFS
ncbi:NAD(P)/FAD-dependent oxidoreductase [Hydrogenimonas sp.]